MYFTIEPSGCCERNGLVQVRFSFFLDPGDARYDEHHVDVPDFTNHYPGKKNEEEYAEWVKGLPQKKQLNPFHSHFAYYDPSVSDTELQADGEKFLIQAYAKWSKSCLPNIISQNMIRRPEVVTDDRIAACKHRVAVIKALK